jgi:integrase
VKFTRQRYQSGSLSREVRKAGPAVWIFRWRENATEGRVYRVVGTIEQFPTKTAANVPLKHFAQRSTRSIPQCP